VVDVYDALTTERPYKKPFSIDQSIKAIEEGAGTHFDPCIASLFSKAKGKLELARAKLL
jgi:energy-coupling factor transport system substrate-specific component